MHGLIFAGFSKFIHARYPSLAAAIWESEPTYDPAKAYSDDDFTRILTRAIERTGDGSRGILLEFGRFAAQNTLYELYPATRRRTRLTRCFACTAGIPRASSTRLPAAERFVQRLSA